MGTFYVENFGCRATQADGAAIERQFREHGLDRAATPTQAEVVVLNTCTVTASADQDARAAIRRIHRENPSCQIVVTGCYAQRAPEEVAALPGVSSVVGNSHKHVLADIASRSSVFSRQSSAKPPVQRTGSIAKAAASSFVPLSQLADSLTTDDRRLTTEVFVSDIFAHTELLAAPVFDSANERTRPNLKVQDGCDNRCSFCVIPYVRGQSRSLPLDRILSEVNALVATGYREVVISGINLGRWGRDLPVVGRSSGTQSSVVSLQSSAIQHRTLSVVADWHITDPGFVSLSQQTPGGPELTTDDRRLTTLVSAILSCTSLEKLRISSVEPMDWSDELIALVAESPRIAKHAHVPLQSGSDRILRAMHRKYRPWHYEAKIRKIRSAMPTAAIGADVMVGFPGESDGDFDQTYRMIESLPFTYLHVFTYSARPGTPAAAMPGQVPVQIARERNRMLRDLAAEKRLHFMRSFVGKSVDAITLNVFDGEFTEALTENYLKLKIKGRHKSNRWIGAQISDVFGGVLLGTHCQAL